MMKITVKRVTDWGDCDTCGSSYAEGANVLFDGEPVFALEPVAHCFGGQTFSDDDIFGVILDKLGHSLEVSDEESD